MVHISELIADVGEQHNIYGGMRSGKSSMMDWEIRTISQKRPKCMGLVVDTKPRFRAETERMPMQPYRRRSAAHHYETWAKGPVIPNSVLVDLRSDHPFRGLWKSPGEVAIMQSGETEDWIRMLQLLKAFKNAHIKDRERHVWVDEVMDFYQRNTMGIHAKNDVFYNVSRAGGERHIGITICAQRVYGIPELVRNGARRITLFHLRSDNDMKFLRENGITDAASPEGNYVFKQWRLTPGGTLSVPVTGVCDYPESYLNQLSAS